MIEPGSGLKLLFDNQASQTCLKALLTTHAEISQIDYPLVASTVKFDTYMDEIINLETQLACCQQVQELQYLIQGICQEVSFIWIPKKQ
jgi:hypothetical protein